MAKRPNSSRRARGLIRDILAEWRIALSPALFQRNTLGDLFWDPTGSDGAPGNSGRCLWQGRSRHSGLSARCRGRPAQGSLSGADGAQILYTCDLQLSLIAVPQ